MTEPSPLLLATYRAMRARRGASAFARAHVGRGPAHDRIRAREEACENFLSR